MYRSDCPTPATPFLRSAAGRFPREGGGDGRGLVGMGSSLETCSSGCDVAPWKHDQVARGKIGNRPTSVSTPGRNIQALPTRLAVLDERRHRAAKDADQSGSSQGEDGGRWNSAQKKAGRGRPGNRGMAMGEAPGAGGLGGAPRAGFLSLMGRSRFAPIRSTDVGTFPSGNVCRRRVSAPTTSIVSDGQAAPGDHQHHADQHQQQVPPASRGIEERDRSTPQAARRIRRHPPTGDESVTSGAEPWSAPGNLDERAFQALRSRAPRILATSP